MENRTPPMAMAKKIVRLLRQERPDDHYLKKVFQHTRILLEIKRENQQKRLPDLLSDEELLAFYDAVWHAHHPMHMVMIKLLIYTGIRNAELAAVRLRDVNLDKHQIRVEQGKGAKDRYVLFPESFRGELAQYMAHQKDARAVYLFESNRQASFSPRRIRQIVQDYAAAAGIEKRVYPHLFRHQIITFLSKQGIISPKLQLISGHANERSLAIYRDLALADVADEYESAMKSFPIK